MNLLDLPPEILQSILEVLLVHRHHDSRWITILCGKKSTCKFYRLTFLRCLLVCKTFQSLIVKTAGAALTLSLPLATQSPSYLDLLFKAPWSLLKNARHIDISIDADLGTNLGAIYAELLAIQFPARSRLTCHFEPTEGYLKGLGSVMANLEAIAGIDIAVRLSYLPSAINVDHWESVSSLTLDSIDFQELDIPLSLQLDRLEVRHCSFRNGAESEFFDSFDIQNTLVAYANKGFHDNGEEDETFDLLHLAEWLPDLIGASWQPHYIWDIYRDKFSTIQGLTLHIPDDFEETVLDTREALEKLPKQLEGLRFEIWSSAKEANLFFALMWQLSDRQWLPKLRHLIINRCSIDWPPLVMDQMVNLAHARGVICQYGEVYE